MWFSGTFLGIDSALLPESWVESKTKTEKTALGQSGMLRIWRCDCALCVIGNEFPCRQPHNHSTPSHEGIPHCPKDKNRSPFTAKNP